MNPSTSALKAALILLGESESSIKQKIRKAHSYSNSKENVYWFEQSEQNFREIVGVLAFEESQKAVRLLFKNPSLQSDHEFIEYQKTVNHVKAIVLGSTFFVAGRGAVTTYAEPIIEGYRIGTWIEEDAE